MPLNAKHRLARKILSSRRTRAAHEAMQFDNRELVHALLIWLAFAGVVILLVWILDWLVRV